MLAARSVGGTVDAAHTLLSSPDVIRTFAAGGATAFTTPRAAADLLALRAAGRQWERRSWQSFYRLTPAQWPELRACVRSALAAGPLTRRRLAERVTLVPAFAHLGDAFTHPSWTFIKPFAWQGDLRLGPTIDGEATVQSFDGVAGWRGTSPLAEAGPRAVRDFLAAYAPATETQLHAWFTAGLTVRRRLVGAWLEELDSITTARVAGERAYLRAEDAEELMGATPSETVVLLPAFDPWLFAGGTDFAPIVPGSRRALLSHGGRALIAGGAVRGVWHLEGESVDIELFGEVRPPGSEDLAAGVARLSEVLQRELSWRMRTM